MKDLTPSRSFWLFFGVVIWTLVVTVLRTIRSPNTWAISQWLLDYRFGFIKRGLVGTFGTLTARFFGSELSPEFITYCSAVFQGVFYLFLLAVCFRLLRGQAGNNRAPLAILIFLSSPFIVMSAHTFAYFDALLYLLSIAAIGLILRGRIYLAGCLQAIAVLCHESYLVMGFPAACLAAWLSLPALHWNEIRNHIIALCIPIVAMAAIVISMRLTNTAELHEEIAEYYIAAGIDAKQSNLLANFQTRSFVENLRRNGKHFWTRSFHPEIWMQIGPALACFFFLIYSTFQIRWFSRLSLLLLGIIFAPFAVHSMAFDHVRISIYSIGSIFLVYWVLAESKLARSSLPLPKSFYFLAGPTLVYHALMHVMLLDRETDRFSFEWRLMLYAPMLLVFSIMAIRRCFPPGAKSLMSSPGPMNLILLGIFSASLLAGCSESGSPAASSVNKSDPALALKTADEAMANDEALTNELIGSVLSIESDSPDIQLWLAQTSHTMGQLLYRDGQTERAIDLLLKAGTAMKEAEQSGQKLMNSELEMRGPIYYDQACALSLAGQPEKALVPLRRCVEVGYGEAGLFLEDSDLNAVRELPGYPAFYAEQMKFHKTQLAQEMQQFQSYPLEFNLVDLEGKKFSLAEMQGKVVVLDFWATWCRPCLMSMPHLDKIYEQEKSNGLEVIGLNYEGPGGNNQVVKKVEQTVANLKLHYRCAIGDAATEEQIPNLEGLPTMVFIDRAGKVRYQVTGAHSRDYVLAILEPLLAEKAPVKSEE